MKIPKKKLGVGLGVRVDVNEELDFGENSQKKKI